MPGCLDLLHVELDHDVVVQLCTIVPNPAEAAKQLVDKDARWISACCEGLACNHNDDPRILGVVLAFARALGEFGATITFAGSYPGTTETMPLRVYLALQDNPDAAIALSLVLLVVSVVILAGLRDRWLRL